MKFRLVYEGAIGSHPRIKWADIHKIRRDLHPQMRALWDFPPLAKETAKWLSHYDPADQSDYAILEQRGSQVFAPLISRRNDLRCELEILMLRQQAPGQLIGDGGDIDNRVKTLLDALSVPPYAQSMQFDSGPTQPIYCLLQDDSLVTRVNVETDRLLRPIADPRHLVAIITIELRALKVTYGNLGLVG